jgi:hypothetical protein
MTAKPLKWKIYHYNEKEGYWIRDDKKYQFDSMPTDDIIDPTDVASAVEWLKGCFSSSADDYTQGYILRKIDEAFADVVKK